jgi:hypothetical protein
MEFLRFGSSIPGSYWGCCAGDVIQNFKVGATEPASIQLVEGDGGSYLGKFAGKTYHDIFRQRLVYGTFSADKSRAVNHAFFVMLSDTQLKSEIGKQWLAILKAEGFEFVRTVNNSVWNVNNYIFMLVRNVGPNAVEDQFKPPQEWLDLPSVVPEIWSLIDADAIDCLPGGETRSLTTQIAAKQKPLYDALPKDVFYTEAELEAEGIPITYAGKRSHQHGQPAIGYPQQSKEERQKFEAALTAPKPTEAKPSAFPAKAAMPPVQS